MNQRQIPPHFTSEQRAFLTWVTTTHQHLFLRATAGAGKTTTLVEAAWHLKTSGMYFAYNKHAVAGLQPRLPSHIQARTPHAYGLRLLYLQSEAATLSKAKGRQVAARTLGGSRVHLYAAARVWDMAREECIVVPTPEQALRLAARCEWRGPPEDLCELVPAMHELGNRLWNDERVADYSDMLWLPVTHGYSAGTLRTAMVDEAQDLTPLRQAFILRLLNLPGGPRPGRLIFVGDSDQSVYKYAGADPAALGRLKSAVGAVELPLSVSWRCPQEVVRYARAHSDFIQPSPHAPAGRIEHVQAEGLEYVQGDAVLCRTNSPLIRLALELMIRRISVCVLGRDLERRLGEAISAALPENRPFQNNDVNDLVTEYLAPLDAPLKQRVLEGDKTARQQSTELRDLGRCLRYLAWIVSRKTGIGTQAEALALLGELCQENLNADVLLSSVHRAKGKEWPRVTLLYPEQMPHPSGDPEEERAVQFVAITRAQHTLRFAYGNRAWAAQQWVKPGTLPPHVQPIASSPALPIRRGRPPKRRQGPMLIGPTCSDPLLGGEMLLPRQALQQRLLVLANDERLLIRLWALQRLQTLMNTFSDAVGIHEELLTSYEQAAALARSASPGKKTRGVAVCVFDARTAQVRFARKIRVGKGVIRLQLGDEALRFDPRGELLGGDGPLSTFILPAALKRLKAS